MNFRDIILMGFVNKAADYLKEKIGDNRSSDLEELNSLSMDELKDELLKRVKGSLEDAGEKASELMKLGSEAFSEFISNARENELINEFVEIFDDSIPDKSETLPEEKKEEVKEEVKEENTDKVKEDLDELLSFYQPVDQPQIDDDDEYLRIISEAAARANMQENPEIFEEVKPEEEEVKEEISELDQIFNEIVNSEEEIKPEEPVKKEEEKKEEVKPEVQREPETLNDAYLRDLVDGLKKSLEEEKKETKPEIKQTVFEKIMELYPYLTGGFIRAVYDLKSSLSREYADGEKIVILHRVYFKDVDSLRQFVEIVSNHDYTVNVDENKLIVDVFKMHVNQDGRILTNIYEIANQARVLEGEYEGYRVVRLEEK